MNSNKIKKGLRIIFSRRLVPRIRAILWAYRYNLSSPNAYIYKPIKFTPKYVKWDKGVIILNNARIEGVSRYGIQYFSPIIEFGESVTIQQGCHITCAQSIKIGKNTALGAYVTVTDIDHPYEDPNLPIERQDLKVKQVTIGEDCKIYNNSVILQGVNIGKHCVVGANSVVTKDIPDYCVAVGSPAYIIKRYDFERKEWRKTNKDGSFI